MIAEGYSEADYEVFVKGNTASYTIEGVSAGTYTMKVMKNNHVTREYTVVVGNSSVIQDVKIHLKGDINGDGAISSGDNTLMMRHIRSTKLLTGYEFLCADINRDSSISSGDNTLMMRHIRNTKLLW